VKVEVLSIYDPSDHRFPTLQLAEKVESVLQEWLNDNPNAQIEYVVQTPLAESNGQTWSLLTTIFYRD
jgi:hypothetical protein